MTHMVDIVTVPVTEAAVIRFRVRADELPRIGESLGHAFGTVMNELRTAGLAPAGPALAHYRPVADGYEVSAGFEVAPATALPSGLERLDLGDIVAAHTTHIGSYATLPTAYAELMAQAERVGWRLGTGCPMWEEYWSERGTPESETRTEIYWPVTSAG